MTTEVITADELRSEVNYDPETGVFTWKKKKRGRRHGAIGNLRPDGYLRIGFGYRNYLAHRLAWLYVTGALPSACIDHIDGNPLNNKFSNLRDVSESVNHENLRKSHKDSVSGLLGVSFHNRDKLWRARIHTNGKHVTIGYFKSKQDAHDAYLESKRKNHSGCTI